MTVPKGRSSEPHVPRIGWDGSPSLPDRYLSPNDLADLLGVPLETVYQWRRKRTGPPGFRVGRHLRYDPEQVRLWISRLAQEAG